MNLFRSAVYLAAFLQAAACSSDNGPGSGGSSIAGGGSGGTVASAGTGGAIGGGGANGGSMSAAGGGMGGGGTAGSGGQGGMEQGGINQGGQAGGGSGGQAGAGGGGFWGPSGPKKQWSCPAGPFGQQMRSNQKNVCEGFQYNYGYNEGPTWIASQNAFFFSNFIQGSNKGGDIIKVSQNGTCEVWVHDVGCNGLGVSPSGNLLAACHGPRAVMEYNVTTKEARVVANMVGGKLLDSPNDLIAHSNGTVYFSNTRYEVDPNAPVGIKEALVRVDPMGKTYVVETGGLNGVALSPDEKKLYVVGKGVWSLDDNGVPLQKMGNDPGGDGLAVDCAGNVTNDQTNSAYGGPDGKTLLIVQGLTARTYQVTIPGLP